MKFIKAIYVSFMVLACTFCKDEDELCIKTSTWESPILTISQADITNIQDMFDNNQLIFNNLQFSNLTETDTHFRVGCFQFYNGLKVFTEPLAYFFNKSESIEFIIGDTISHKSIVLGKTTRMDKNSVFNIYRTSVQSDSKIKWNGSLCYVIEPGYFNLKVSSLSGENEYILAWRINPEGGSVPLVYINDNNEEVIYYDNGIRN